MSHPIRIKKLLESSLPETDFNFTVTFTDKGNLYITNDNGTQRKITDIIVHDTKGDFPTYGAPGKIYIDNQDESIYFWALTRYIPIGGDAQTIAASNVIEEVNKRFLKDDERTLIGNLTGVKSNVQEQIDAITQSNQDETLQGEISALDTKITENREAIAATDAEVEGIKTNIGTVEQSISTIQTDMQTMSEGFEADMSALATEIHNGDAASQQAIATVASNLATAKEEMESAIDTVDKENNLTHISPTYAGIAALTPKDGDVVIVLRDERADATAKPSATYQYLVDTWVFQGALKDVKLRDFTADPINLETEVTGVLPKDNYEAPAAEDVVVNNPNFTGKDVNSVLDELFQYANNIKTSVVDAVGTPLLPSDTGAELAAKIELLKTALADAINAKGVGTLPTDSLETMADNISLITSGGGGQSGDIQKLTKLNVTAPYELKIAPGFDATVGNILATLIEHVPAKSGIVQYQVGFDNKDAADFIENENVSYDGTMHLKNIVSYSMEKDSSWAEEGSLHRKKISKSEWSKINKVSVRGGQ